MNAASLDYCARHNHYVRGEHPVHVARENTISVRVPGVRGSRRIVEVGRHA